MVNFLQNVNCGVGRVCIVREVQCPANGVCTSPKGFCVSAPGTATKDGSCPVATPGTPGSCIQQCHNDDHCRGTLKCCSNGCGMTCQAPQNTGSHYNHQHHISKRFQITHY